jgi:protein phosphatase 1L
MEDRIVTGRTLGALVVGVFDGHEGARVAQHAADHALDLVEKGLARALHVDTLFPAIFADLDLDVAETGSTATLVLVRGHELSAAWVGDSRAVLVRRDGCQVLTPDHRIERSDERERVLAAGAELIPPYACDPDLARGLMVTRALGDRALRGIGIVSDPEVTTVMLGSRDLGFIVATDGLWDVVSNDEAADVCRAEQPTSAARRLVSLVAQRDGQDNVTVVVGRF